MNTLKKYFQKAGGKDFVKKLWHNHILCYSFFMFLALPKSRLGLEILMHCIEYKIFKRLKRKFKKIINQSDSKQITTHSNKTVWFCWLQGIENAPELVKSNFNKIKLYYSDYNIVVITSENFAQYTDIPDFIVKKWKKGIITHTHFSDILRTWLLVKNGGVWIDSTVLATAKVPEDIASAPFFLFRTLKPGDMGKRINVSSWFIQSVENNPVLLLVQNLLSEYWKKHNYLCDYFLFHIFLEIALEKYDNITALIPKYSNEPPHVLQYELRSDIDSKRLNDILKLCFVHKLTNKATIPSIL